MPSVLRAVLVLLLVGALSACGGGHTAEPSTTALHTATWTSLPVATPTPTGPLTTGPNVRPGETPPTPPPMTHDNVGALAFAAYYIQAFDWSLATNDAYLLRRISSSACTACRRILDAINHLSVRNERLTGGRITILRSSIEAGPFAVHADAAVRTETHQDAETVIDADGKQVSKHPASGDVSIVLLNWTTSGWTVREVGEAK